MSTRSYVGSAESKLCVYSHFDGYPEAKLPELAQMIERDGAQKVVETLLSARTGGWSALDPKAGSDTTTYLGERARIVEGYGVAYTDQQTPDGEPTYIGDGMSENDRIWIEWVYLVDPETGNITYWSTSEPPNKAKTVSPADILKEVTRA